MASRTFALLFALTPLACALAAPPADQSPHVWTNSLGMAFVKVPAGRFWMGSAESPGALAQVFPQLERKRFTLLSEETPAMLAALDEGIRSLETEPTVPVEEVRQKIKGWATA